MQVIDALSGYSSALPTTSYHLFQQLPIVSLYEANSHPFFDS